MCDGYGADMLDLVHPDVVIDFRQAFGPAHSWYGAQGVRMLIDEWAEAWGNFHLEAQQFIEVGDAIVVPVRYSRAGLSAGHDAEEEELTHVYRFRGGLVVEWRVFRDVRDAFAVAERSGSARYIH
jgi:ketosteroid isomerase-like protein